MLQSPAALHTGTAVNTAAPAAKRCNYWLLVTVVKRLAMHIIFICFEGS